VKSTWMKLPPQRYPGYYPLPVMVVEQVIVDRTVIAVIKFVKRQTRKNSSATSSKRASEMD